MSELKQNVIKARLEDGLSYTKIREEYGVAKSTAQDWCRAYQEKSNVPETPSNVTGYVNDNLRRFKPEKFRKTEDEVLEFINNLAPIKISPPVYRNPDASLSEYAVVFSDLHFPLQCEKSIAILLEVIEELQPKTIVINGDSCDILALSRYPKDIMNNYNLLQERVAYHQFLHKLIEISNGAKIYETSANHSSGGPESRWRRYLSERIPELGSLPEVLEILTYENIFLGPFKDYVECVDYVDLNGLHVMHGTTVRKNAGSSVLGEMEKYRTSVMMGHVHRLGSVSMRQPAIGSRKESQIRGYEIGCLCDLNPIYCLSPNWANGFAIVALGEDSFGVELVSIVDGKATISTTGRSYEAFDKN
jgi:hypothetical protein